jgi:hypothetical protein
MNCRCEVLSWDLAGGTGKNDVKLQMTDVINKDPNLVPPEYKSQVLHLEST